MSDFEARSTWLKGATWEIPVQKVEEARVEEAVRKAAEPFLTKTGAPRFENMQRFLIAKV